MKWWIKPMICLVVAILLAAGSLVMVKYVTEHPKEEETVMDYSLVREDGKNYIVFDDIEEYSYFPNTGYSIVAGVFFSSMQEFHDRVTNGKLTDGEKRMMTLTFSKDASGAMLVYDFDNLQAPVVPGNVSVGRVVWMGSYYSLFITTEEEIGGQCQFWSPEQYKERYEKNYKDYYDSDTLKVTDTEDLGDGKIATTYTTSTGTFKNIQYVLSDGEKTIEVMKEYNLEYHAMDQFPLGDSSEAPYRITLYCTKGEDHGIVSLSGFTEDPTDEWLMEFGIEKFVDNEDLEK